LNESEDEKERCSAHITILEAKASRATPAGYQICPAWKNPAATRSRNACHGDHLLERTRRDNCGAVGCVCLRLLIAWQAENRE
jgi:hypothetical protein